jgi:hypothetical protein
MTHDDVKDLRALIEESMGKTAGKWKANQKLIQWLTTWIRHDPLAFVEVLDAAFNLRKHHGGKAGQRLDAALQAIQPPEEGAA